MSQARRTRHFARGAKRVRSAFRASRVCKFTDWFSSAFQSLQPAAYSAISPTLASVKTNLEMMIFTDKKDYPNVAIRVPGISEKTKETKKYVRLFISNKKLKA